MTRKFSLFNLSFKTRIIYSALLYAACVSTQILTGSFFTGLIFVLPAWMLLSMKTISNKPDDQGLEKWRAVGEAEIHRIADTIEQTRKAQAKLAVPATFKTIGMIILIAAAVILRRQAAHSSMALFDLAIFCGPAYFSGMVSLHMPQELRTKLQVFMPIMNASRPDSLILTPYVRFDEDPDKNEIPEDLRFMLEPRRKPDELVGVQLQITMNNGPNGPVPYMYAVILMHGRSSALYQKFASMNISGYEVEPGGDNEYGTVVVRQKTSGTGYHTKEQDCLRLYKNVQSALLQH